MAERQQTAQLATFCPMCVSRCGAKATITDGVFTSLQPDPSHPTGRALCVKGKAAPEIVYHPDRLLHPLRRTNPKSAADPGWQRISWDEALDTIATRLLALAEEYGPETVVFGSSSPSTSAISDSVDWVMRLRRAFGSPNFCSYMELCGWGRYMASLYTFGASVPGAYLPDLDNAGCILYWGYNPSVARLDHATSTVAAIARGARLVVVDPRRAGLASKADHWLRVRPGTDAALALALTHLMIEQGWYDEDFVRRWTNAPLLVRPDNGRFLRASELSPTGDPAHYVAWDAVAMAPVPYDPASSRYGADEDRLALRGTYEVVAVEGVIGSRTAFDLLAEHARSMSPAVAEAICGVPATDIEQTARTLWESRPVAFYTWSGLEQHSNTSQTIRAINVLYALTGSFDAPGGNVLFAGVPANPIDGMELLPPQQRAKAAGLQQRPLGPARFEFITGEDFYTGALEGKPYRLRALLNFGANMVMAHGDSARGRAAFTALDFFVHADLFMNPTAELADIVLPVTSPFEAEGLKIGFETSQDAQSLIQLRGAGGPARRRAPAAVGARTRRGPLGPADRLRARDPPRFGRAFLGRQHRRRVQLPTRAERGHASAAACRAVRRADTAHHASPQVRRARWRRTERVPYPDRQDRALLRSARRTRLLAAASIRGTSREPPIAARPRRSLPAGPHLRQVVVVLRDATPQHRKLAASRPRSPGRASSGHRDGTRHWVRRLGPNRHSERQHPSTREVQQQPRPAGRLRSARVVAGLRRARASRLPDVRRRQRQSQLGTAPATQRPHERQLPIARVHLQRRAACCR